MDEPSRDPIMPMWRLLGELPQARSREEVRNQSLEGWNPWEHSWNRCEEHGIVVPDAENKMLVRHAATYWVKRDGKMLKFAVDSLDNNGWRFFVPASSAIDGAFAARTPRHAGFWKSSINADEDLPWPQPDETWSERATFLEAFDSAEAKAYRVVYRGISLCRLCGLRNGHQSLRLDVWEWPEGFRHYVADHLVRPTREFELFIREACLRV